MDTRAPSPEESAPFTDVFAAECEDIRLRRGAHKLGEDGKAAGPPDNLKGLALSGGGIRSATFCLGVLQRLHLAEVLDQFDYLSTVSGGGFIGGWWSAWLARKGQSGVFPPAEKLETDRGKWRTRRDPATAPDGTERPEGSRSAGTDPIHHLRLFANYLTPRKGALSGDTWRAITVVSRNLFLTVLMLVPLLGAAILASQFYFTADRDLVTPYVCDATPTENDLSQSLARPPGDSIIAAAAPVCAFFPAAGEQDPSHHLALVRRAAWLALPLLVLAGALLLSLIFWMLFSIGRFFMAIVAATGVTLIFALLTRTLAWGASPLLLQEISRYHPKTLLLIGALPIAIMAAYLLLKPGSNSSAGAVKPPSRAELLTNRMTKAQSIILVLFTVLAVTLIFGGFAHEAVRHALLEAGAGGSVGSKVAKAGGWLAVLWAGAGALFTGLKAAPTGGADTHAPPPGRLSRLVFAITPSLVLIVLLVFVATLTHAMLSRLIAASPASFPPLVLAFFIAIAICGFFGTYEYWTDADAVPIRCGLVTAAATGLGLLAGAVAWFLVHPLDHPRQFTSAYIGLAVGVVATPWLVRAVLPIFSKPSEPEDRLVRRRARLTTLLFALLPIVGAGLGFASGTIVVHHMPPGQGSPLASAIALGGITFAAVFVLLAVITAIRVNHRMLTLQTLAVILLGPMLMQQFQNPTVMWVAVPTAIVAMVGIVVGSIIGLGWMLDPNYLSLHTFYRARLVRAYLGASNEKRRDSNSEIADSAEGDDVALAGLAGGERGGPCHLINATLNLVGGRDLTTAQRSAAYFTMSRHYCGSLRTGYRPTTDYMRGQLSLGTAVAISGAAASPNMGSKTPSAALAMLMALLNVRLGFWAPTPSQPRWRSPRPRLWPFYLLREFLSQTNDLSLYCYLTDGGHFDNTGLYSLVQRGCRYIVFVDCGADPAPCFSDVGDAIRRCRIDFGADIRLGVENFLAAHRDDTSSPPKEHCVVGEIVYSEEHARDLGWTDLSEKHRTGTMVWIKPSLLKDDPAEVRQYSLENTVFPQQSTADQWFDEAQFESYRRLGETCAEEVLAHKEAKKIFA